MPMKLIDTQTGAELEIPLDRENAMLDALEGKSTGQMMKPPGTIRGTDEKMLEVVLERDNRPDDVKKQFWSLDYKEALGKHTNKEDVLIHDLEIENLILAGYISNKFAQTVFFDLEQAEYVARRDSKRSISYDGTPNEREWIATQGVRQRIENIEAARNSGSALAGIIKAVRGQ